jgi:hypothetical protein
MKIQLTVYLFTLVTELILLIPSYRRKDQIHLEPVQNLVGSSLSHH